MTLPVNFDSVGVDSILADWLMALREQGVEVVLVLGIVPGGLMALCAQAIAALIV